ncbi:MAG: hypothetical protein J6V14_09615 [Clostridia bacterium]|nr:hypothetical protein [Clostridia bacterium]
MPKIEKNRSGVSLERFLRFVQLVKKFFREIYTKISEVFAPYGRIRFPIESGQNGGGKSINTAFLP